MNKIKETLAEAVARLTLDWQHEDVSDAIEEIADYVVDCVNDEVELTDRQAIALNTMILKFLGEEVMDDANNLIREWDKNAWEHEQILREARYA